MEGLFCGDNIARVYDVFSHSDVEAEHQHVHGRNYNILVICGECMISVLCRMVMRNLILDRFHNELVYFCIALPTLSCVVLTAHFTLFLPASS